jgi:hypothetical protein
LLDASSSDLVELLKSDDSDVAKSAACTLIARREFIAPTLLSFLERADKKPQLSTWDETTRRPRTTWSELLDWTRAQLGSAVADMLAMRLAAANDDTQRLHVLDFALVARADLRSAAVAIAALRDAPDPLGERARSLFALLSDEQVPFGGGWDDWGDGWFHYAYVTAAYDDPELEENLARVWAPRLTEAAARADIPIELLRHVHLAGLRSARVRDACEPTLLELAKRDDALGLEALRLLCHFGSKAPLVRERYMARMTSWNDFTTNGLDKIPCLQHHDERSLAALRAVFDRANSKSVFEDRLACAGLIDGTVEPMAQTLLERLADASYAYTVEKEFRGILPVSAGDSKIARVHKYALTIAAKRAHGLDWSQEAHDYASILRGGYPESGAGGYNDYFEWGFVNAIHLKLTTPEFVDAALKVAEDGDVLDGGTGFDLHVNYACDLLAIAELTPEQKARFYKAAPHRASGPDTWQGITLIENHERGTDIGKDALERVVDYRRDLYRGEWESLNDILAVTHLIPRDETFLLAALDRGSVAARSFGLDLVDEHKLDTPSIRAAIAKLANDCDRKTRELARKIRSECGWK